MRGRNKKWIYMLLLMGLLLKFVITGLIVIFTIRGTREEKLNKIPDLDSSLQNTIIFGTQAWWTGMNPETTFVISVS